MTMRYNANHLRIPLIVAAIWICLPLSGQKYLQLEKKNSIKTEKIPLGSLVSIKTTEFPKTWYSGRLDDILAKDGILVFDTKAIRVEDIIVLRKNNGSFVYRTARTLSKLFRNLGINIAFWGTFDATLSNREQLETSDDRRDLLKTYWSIGVGSYIASVILNNVFKLGSYKIGRKWNLRALDLTIENHLSP